MTITSFRILPHCNRDLEGSNINFANRKPCTNNVPANNIWPQRIQWMRRCLWTSINLQKWTIWPCKKYETERLTQQDKLIYENPESEMFSFCICSWSQTGKQELCSTMGPKNKTKISCYTYLNLQCSMCCYFWPECFLTWCHDEQSLVFLKQNNFAFGTGPQVILSGWEDAEILSLTCIRYMPEWHMLAVTSPELKHQAWRSRRRNNRPADSVTTALPKPHPTHPLHFFATPLKVNNCKTCRKWMQLEEDSVLKGWTSRANAQMAHIKVQNWRKCNSYVM